MVKHQSVATYRFQASSQLPRTLALKLLLGVEAKMAALLFVGRSPYRTLEIQDRIEGWLYDDLLLSVNTMKPPTMATAEARMSSIH